MKKIAKLLLACSQEIATIPHEVFCKKHDVVDKMKSSMPSFLSGLIDEAASQSCQNVEPDLITNSAINPDHVSRVEYVVHPREVKGVYLILLTLVGGSEHWAYTDQGAYEKDKAFFDARTGTVDTYAE